MNRNIYNFRNPNGDGDPRTGRPDQYVFTNNYGTIYPPIPAFSRFSPPQPILEGNRGGYDPSYWRSTEETIIASRPLLIGLPLQPVPSRMEIQVVNNNRIRPNQTQLEAQPSSSSSRLITRQLDEQNNALRKLRKEIYNPVPKRISSRLCLYYRDQASRIVNEMEKEREEEGKRCAICLEDFEAKEIVMLTPCNHMFHEDCIVPWVKSNAQCPVCRSSVWDPSHGTSGSTTSSSSTNVVVPNNNDDLFTGGDLISILRAMGVM